MFTSATSLTTTPTCEESSHGFPWVSHGFPMGFPGFPWVSHGFPMGFPRTCWLTTMALSPSRFFRMCCTMVVFPAPCHAPPGRHMAWGRKDGAEAPRNPHRIDTGTFGGGSFCRPPTVPKQVDYPIYTWIWVKQEQSIHQITMFIGGMVTIPKRVVYVVLFFPH